MKVAVEADLSVGGSELVDWGMVGLATFSVASTMNGGDLFELIKSEVESQTPHSNTLHPSNPNRTQIYSKTRIYSKLRPDILNPRDIAP